MTSNGDVIGDTRRLTSPSLRICGRIASSDVFGDDDVGAGSSPLTWIGGLFSKLRCGRRRPSKDTSVRTSHQLVTFARKNPSQLNFSWLSGNAVTDNFKALLVFPREDQQCEILSTVARRLGWSVTEARNGEEAIEMFRMHCHDVVIIDRRGGGGSASNGTQKHDADEICRSIKCLSINKRTPIIALTKRAYFTAPHKEESTILHLLNIGYTRALLECSHEGILMNELIGLYSTESQPKSQLAAAQLMYFAVDRCRDMIQVTNDQHVLQYSNRASEKVLGYKMNDLVGKKMDEYVKNSNFELMDQQLKRGREFEGQIIWKRRRAGEVTLNCRVVPMTVTTGQSLYYIYLYDNGADSSGYGRSSTLSYSRPSFELRTSNKPRRSTIAKLHNLQLEAPITRVILLLKDAMYECKLPDVTKQIETAINILKNTELYIPRLREDDSMPMADPETSELIGALIATETPKLERTSTAEKQTSVMYTNIIDIDAKIMKSPQGPPELEDLLEYGFEWGFDIFKLETITNQRPLFYLGMMVMSHYRVPELLECDARILQNWLTIIEANYNDISYHNSTHATDVLQAIARFMRSDRLREILDPMDEVAALLAAAAHDIGHPGKSSQFLCNSSNRLAVLYNDLTVLESHHSALTFKVTLADDNVNIFKNLSRDIYKSMRHNIIDMILATEMTKHFEHLAKFVNVCSNRVDDIEGFDDDILDMSIFLLPENVTLTKRMMIKCADVSNPTRPFRLYVEWTRRIAIEYFDQTDEEKKNNLPVVMPMFDRATCSIPKSQIGFVDYIINDMMEAWDAFIDMPEMVGNMRENYDKWKDFYEQNYNTLEDLERLQQTPDLKLYTKEGSRRESKKKKKKTKNKD